MPHARMKDFVKDTLGAIDDKLGAQLAWQLSKDAGERPSHGVRTTEAHELRDLTQIIRR